MEAFSASLGSAVVVNLNLVNISNVEIWGTFARPIPVNFYQLVCCWNTVVFAYTLIVETSYFSDYFKPYLKETILVYWDGPLRIMLCHAHITHNDVLGNQEFYVPCCIFPLLCFLRLGVTQMRTLLSLLLTHYVSSQWSFWRKENLPTSDFRKISSDRLNISWKRTGKDCHHWETQNNVEPKTVSMTYSVASL